MHITADDVNAAIRWATDIHYGEYRKRYIGGSRLPYITHCLEVMKTVWRWGAGDYEMLAAAILHDSEESLNENKVCPDDVQIAIVAEQELKNWYQLRQNVAALVDELTFEPDEKNPAAKEEYMHSFKTKSIRALVIKCADRICNTLDFAMTDPHYAWEYWEKAGPLWDAFETRCPEIEREFGEAVYQCILSEYHETKRKIGGQK